jgi:hypothetical protein
MRNPAFGLKAFCYVNLRDTHAIARQRAKFAWKLQAAASLPEHGVNSWRTLQSRLVDTMLLNWR